MCEYVRVCNSLNLSQPLSAHTLLCVHVVNCRCERAGLVPWRLSKTAAADSVADHEHWRRHHALRLQQTQQQWDLPKRGTSVQHSLHGQELPEAGAGWREGGQNEQGWKGGGGGSRADSMQAKGLALQSPGFEKTSSNPPV